MPEMKTEPNALTRRDALKRALHGALATAAIAPAIGRASTSLPAPAQEPEFVPENDYPFFGGEVPDAYSDCQ